MVSDTPEVATDAVTDELFHARDRVPLVYWRQFSGARTTVLLIGAVTVVAFVTGLSHISRGASGFDGPLAAYVSPGVGELLPASGVAFAFVLAVVAVALHRGYRLGFYGAVVVLPLAMVLPLMTAEATDVLLLVLSMVALPLVVRNRHQFDRAVDPSPLQVVALSSLAGVQIYGTVGTYVLRDQFNGIESWTDAFYYIVVTGTTVGYGDATPVTPKAKVFTLSLLVVGTAAFGAAFGSLLVPAIESRVSSAFGNMTASDLALLEDHVLVLGHGDLTEPLLDELDDDTEVVVVTPDADEASALTDRGVKVLTADPTDERALLDANVETAAGVVAATDDDARNTLAVLAARQANPDVRVVAAARDPLHLDKLEAVGADEVISPTVIGGRLLGRSVLDESLPTFDGTEADEGSGGAGS